MSCLRGVAILLVFFSHIHFGDEWKDELFVIGRIGVVLFLMMAGFLAFGSVQKKSRKEFVWNRFLRIYPVFWILLLMTYMLHPGLWSLTELLKNLTLFQEFISTDCIIGSSWMLSIMVIFFGILCVAKNKLTIWIPLIYGGLGIGSIICAVARYLLGLPFPTALFLLQMIGLIGCISKSKGEKFSRQELRAIIVFEMVLAVSTPLSYGNWPFYIVAYNIGIAIFYLFKNWELHNVLLSSFSTVGFTFFLGADIPIDALLRIFPEIASTDLMVWVVIKFFSALLFAFLMTKYVEEPLLRWGKTKIL